MNFLSENNKITSQQYGFISGRNAMTNLIKCHDDWTKIIDEGDCLDVIFLDFKKAFDSVPHKRLLNKIADLGISNQCLQWIEKILTNRSQLVKINNATSSESPVISGVPQGSVMGPTIFIMFINDLPVNIRNKLFMFADDVKIYRRITNINDCKLLQDDLDNLQKWSEKWQLHFNPTKCQLLRLGKNHPIFNYQLGPPQNRENIAPVNSVSDLGVTTSKNLSPDEHIAKATSKATRVSFTVKRTMGHLTKESGRALFCAPVRPIVEYGASVWMPAKIKDIEVVEKVQRRFTKMIPELKDLTYEQRLRSLKVA
jgi:hypothetical protein